MKNYNLNIKNLNIFIVKYLQPIIFIYIVENTIFIKKLRRILGNILIWHL